LQLVQEALVAPLLGEVLEAAGQLFIQAAEMLQVDQGVPTATRRHVGEHDQVVLTQVAQGQQGIQSRRGDHLHAQSVVDDLSHVVGLVQELEYQAVPAFLFFVEDVQEGDGQGAAPQAEAAFAILVDVLLEAVQDLTLDLREELGAQGVVDVADGVHDAQERAGPSLPLGAVAVRGPDQEVAQIRGALHVSRKDQGLARAIILGTEVTLDEGHSLDVDAPGHVPVLVVVQVIPVMQEELVSLFPVHHRERWKIDGGETVQDEPEDLP